MSTIVTIREYLNKMLAEVSGMKALLMDKETIGMVSMVYSQSEGNQKEVFLFQSLETAKKDEVTHLKAVCFLRPTAENITCLLDHLKEPRFAEYHLYFSNILPKAYLKQLAEADDSEVIRGVYEYFADFYAVNSDLFTLNLRQTRMLLAPHWGPRHYSTFSRIVDGLAATLLGFKKSPIIRYQGKSDICKKVAVELAGKMKEENGLFDFPRSEGDPLLLILDRRDDPVSPLLLQWSYQAMIHELLGVHNHRVDFSKVQGIQKEFKEVVLSPETDHFYKGVMFQNWGDVATQIHELVQNYARQNKDNRKIQSFEEMKDFVENYPQFRALQTNACKHMTVASELQKHIESRNLLDVTELEQELACTDNHADALEKLLHLIDSHSNDDDKLRCACLFALRYEQVTNEIDNIKKLLTDKAKTETAKRRVQLIDALLDYAGAAVRGSDLFANKSLGGKLSNFFQAFKSEWQGAQSAITQHVPLLDQIINQLGSRSLSAREYPYLEAAPKQQANHRFVILFMVGGATYEEAALVSALNAKNPNTKIILGSTFIHNSSTFLSDVSSDDHVIDFESIDTQL